MRPHLQELNRETKHTCHPGILDGEVGVYLDKFESHDYGIKLFSEMGKSFPLYCTGLGKALLAFADADDVVGAISTTFPSYVESDRGIESEI